MNGIVDYMIGVKAKTGVKSSRELARKIGLSQPQMNNIMQGMSTPSDATCLKIAEFAGDDPAQVILLAHASKAPASTRKHWDRMLKALTAAALCAAIFAAPTNALAATEKAGFDRLYIMLNRLRTFLRGLFKPFPIVMPCLALPCNHLTTFWTLPHERTFQNYEARTRHFY